MNLAPAGAQIWIVAGRTDMRRGFTGLSALVQQTLSRDPFSGFSGSARGLNKPRRERAWCVAATGITPQRLG